MRKDTITMLQTAYWIAAMKKTQVYDWYRRFKNRQDKVTDEHRSGRPASLASRHIAEIKSFLAHDRRITIREIVDRVDCSIGTVHDILHNKLNMRRVCARWIPRMLTDEQKRQRVECCLRLVERFEREGDAFLKRIVTVDETWISLYEPETKEQSTMWKTPGSPSPKKFKVSPSKKKQMFIVFFDAKGVILSHAVPQGRTVTSQYYAKVLSRDFMRAMRKKRGAELPTMILHHDNAPAHRAATTQQTISRLSIEMLEHPPYVQDLAPCDFVLFPVLKKALRGHQFGDIDLLPTAVQSAISTIPNESYSNSFNAWVKRLSKTRAWVIGTILLVALIVALGLGLGFGLNKSEKLIEVQSSEKECPEVRTSARLPTDSPLYITPTSTKEGVYRFVAVASHAPPCATIGTEIMGVHGGTAADAAIATILCVSVFSPQSSGIGGGSFIHFYKRLTGTSKVIVSREMAPGASTEDMYKQPGYDSLEGGKAIGIPGEVKGLYELWKMGGKLPWDVLFKPAIQMCMDGFTVGSVLARDIEGQQAFYDRHPNLKAMVTRPGTNVLYKDGDTMKRPKLGTTLQRIANDPFTFYNGTLAQDIIADLQEADSIITADDLLRYTAIIKDPLMVNLTGNVTAFSPPPPSSGGVVLLILNILSGFDLNDNSIKDMPAVVDTYHKIIEAMKHGFALRSGLGDYDVEDQAFKDNILATLANATSDSFAATKRNLITYMTHPLDYYNPAFQNDVSDAGTSHISVKGPNGDAVGITSTINIWFGSKVVGSRTGIVFNDEMDDFSTPNTTNFFGYAPSPTNFIKPFKRPMSSMSPTIIVDKTTGDVRLVLGASGGSRIISAIVFNTVEMLMLRLGVKEAIDMPRVHHQLLPLEVEITDRFQEGIKSGLEQRGHSFRYAVFGSAVNAVLQLGKEEIYSAADPYKGGNTDGY